LSAILLRVSGKTYRPRFERLEHLYDALGRSMAALTLSGCRIGPAPKALRHFGTATLEVRREKPRGRAVANTDSVEKTAQKKVPAGTFVAQAGGKLPKKRRIITRLSGS
jgi:hypothetical protein